MASEPIRYYDRYAKAVKIEAVYGERWLRLAYGNPVGRLFVQLVARRAWFSMIYGWQMNKKISFHRILPFIVKYNIDVEDFVKKPWDFRNFNEFFYRALKPERRPIASEPELAVFPADGRHLAFQDFESAEGVYAKGVRFSLEELLGDAELARRYAGGSVLISRLCPVDYHRFHFPAAGVPAESLLINGWLYSVSPIALRRNIRYLVENKRMVTLIASERFGAVAMIEIGATNVGSVRQSFVPGRPMKKGDEKGHFAFGGSCVVTLFERGRIRFDSDIVEQTRNQTETYARMGDRLGTAMRTI
jgi:phosphatidylserine decarboxylase